MMIIIIYGMYIHYLNICVLLFIFFIQCLLNLGGRKINEDFYNLDYPVKKGSVRITTRWKTYLTEVAILRRFYSPMVPPNRCAL